MISFGVLKCRGKKPESADAVKLPVCNTCALFYR